MSGEHNPRLRRRPSLVLLPVALLTSLLLMGTGCTAPTQDHPAAAGEPAPVAQAPAAPAPPVSPPPVRETRTAQAPPMSDPLPPVRASDRDAARAQRNAPTPTPTPTPTPAEIVKIDTSCTGDADCTIKNVGNCCGYYPACVNVDSPTDPAGVQAQCAREGRMSVCGFPSISACQCVAGECQGVSAAVEQ